MNHAIWIGNHVIWMTHMNMIMNDSYEHDYEWLMWICATWSYECATWFIAMCTVSRVSFMLHTAMNLYICIHTHSRGSGHMNHSYECATWFIAMCTMTWLLFISHMAMNLRIHIYIYMIWLMCDMRHCYVHHASSHVHVVHVNELWGTCEWVMSHMKNESCHDVRHCYVHHDSSHVTLAHVAHASHHTRQWILSHMSHVAHADELWGTSEYILSHMKNEPCHDVHHCYVHQDSNPEAHVAHASYHTRQGSM